MTLEGDNPAEGFKLLGTSDDAFTQWFVQKVKEIHGLDLTHPSEGMMPERYVDTDTEIYRA